MIALLILSLQGFVLSPEVSQGFEEANAAYTEGHYADAEKIYKELNERYRMNNPVVLFNLANACYKQEEFGRAILYYEAALAVDPDFAPARTNLEKSLGKTRRSLPVPDPRMATGSMLLRYYPFSPRQSLGLVYAFLISAVLLLLLRHWFRLLKYAWPLWISLGLALFFYGFALATDYALRDLPKRAVIISQEIPVYFSMNESEQPRFMLYEGDRVLVDRLDGHWLRLIAYGDERGWTRKEGVGIVDHSL